MDNLEVTPIEDKMRETRVDGLIMYKGGPYMQTVRKLDCLDITEILRGRGRPKKTWI